MLRIYYLAVTAKVVHILLTHSVTECVKSSNTFCLCLVLFNTASLRYQSIITHGITFEVPNF